MAELFTRIFTFERQLENLKVSLFRQSDVNAMNMLELYQSLFKALDYSRQGKFSLVDLRIFVQCYLPALMPYPDRIHSMLI